MYRNKLWFKIHDYDIQEIVPESLGRDLTKAEIDYILAALEADIGPMVDEYILDIIKQIAINPNLEELNKERIYGT